MALSPIQDSMNALAATVGAVPFSKVPVSVCTRMDGTSNNFHEIYHAVPILKGFSTSWELNFEKVNGIGWNLMEGLHYMGTNNWIPIMFVVLYGIGIVAGQQVMKDRKAFDLRWSLAAWNLFLSLFSGWGMVRIWPHLLYNWWAFPAVDNICASADEMYGCGITGIWVQLFILSKIPELVDTVFIVLRKKKLVFLHWYHHITVLLFCWHSYVTESPIGIYFIAMNYAVHFAMYGYYFLMAVKMLPKWFPAGLITIAQISQMFVGVVITIVSIWLYNSRPGCTVKFQNCLAGGLMYMSYFVLFVHFAIERYFLKPQKKGSAKDAKIE